MPSLTCCRDHTDTSYEAYDEARRTLGFINNVCHPDDMHLLTCSVNSERSRRLMLYTIFLQQIEKSHIRVGDTTKLNGQCKSSSLDSVKLKCSVLVSAAL